MTSYFSVKPWQRLSRMGLAQGSAKPGSAYRLPAGCAHLDIGPDCVNPETMNLRWHGGDTRRVSQAKYGLAKARAAGAKFGTKELLALSPGPERCLCQIRKGRDNGVAGCKPQKQNSTPHKAGRHLNPLCRARRGEFARHRSATVHQCRLQHSWLWGKPPLPSASNMCFRSRKQETPNRFPNYFQPCGAVGTDACAKQKEGRSRAAFHVGL